MSPDFEYAAKIANAIENDPGCIELYAQGGFVRIIDIIAEHLKTRRVDDAFEILRLQTKIDELKRWNENLSANCERYHSEYDAVLKQYTELHDSVNEEALLANKYQAALLYNYESISCDGCDGGACVHCVAAAALGKPIRK